MTSQEPVTRLDLRAIRSLSVDAVALLFGWRAIGWIETVAEQTATPITTATPYQYLESRPGSTYRQLFVNGRRIRAAMIHEAVHCPNSYTPKEFAHKFDVPLEADHEPQACTEDKLSPIASERDREVADIRSRGRGQPLRP
jgi:hypothetical protein